jgi:hypothetical protein
VPEYHGSNPTASTKVFTQFEFSRPSWQKQVPPPWSNKKNSGICQLDISTAGNSDKPISAISRPFPPEVAFQQLATATPTSTAICAKWAKLASKQVASTEGGTGI